MILFFIELNIPQDQSFLVNALVRRIMLNKQMVKWDSNEMIIPSYPSESKIMEYLF